jgi:hypothetical protein
MFRVASLCAIIDIRSCRGGWLTRSFQSFLKYSPHSPRIDLLFLDRVDHAAPGTAVAMSDQ